mgnify:CR=1 FL=1
MRNCSLHHESKTMSHIHQFKSTQIIKTVNIVPLVTTLPRSSGLHSRTPRLQELKTLLSIKRPPFCSTSAKDFNPKIVRRYRESRRANSDHMILKVEVIQTTTKNNYFDFEINSF